MRRVRRRRGESANCSLFFFGEVVKESEEKGGKDLKGMGGSLQFRKLFAGQSQATAGSRRQHTGVLAASRIIIMLVVVSISLFGGERA